MHIFNKSRLIIISIVTIMLSCPFSSAETKVSRILEQVVESHKQFITGMSVSYEREIISKSMAMLDGIEGDRAAGIFFFKDPNLLKVQQDTPSKEYVISNGKSVWWYIPDEKTAYRFDDMEKELSILSMIFTGLKNPRDNFDVTVMDSKEAEEYILTLTPIESLDEIDHINVTVSEKNYRITCVEIIDIVENLTRFKLGEFNNKNDIDDSFFDFKVPEGVKIIEEE